MKTIDSQQTGKVNNSSTAMGISVRISLQLLVIDVLWFLTISTQAASSIQLGLITQDSAEIFLKPDCAKYTEWTVEYRHTESGVTGRKAVSNPPYATKISGLKPASEYQVRNYPSIGGEFITRLRPDWSKATTFRTDLHTAFGRVSLKRKSYNQYYARINTPEWNTSLSTIQDRYSKLNIPYDNVEIIKILRSKLNNPVVHYRFKIKDLSTLTMFKLTGSDFEDSLIHSGGAPNGTSYVIKEGNKVILYYDTSSECFSLIERYMMVSQDDGNASDIHLNVADSYATLSSEEDGLEITSNGDMLRDDGISVGKLDSNTIVMLTPRFLILDCLTDGKLPIYSEVYGGIDYTTKQPMDIIYKYIEPPMVHVDPVTLKVKRARSRAMVYIPPVPNAFKYEILIKDNIVSNVTGEDVKCQTDSTAIIHGLKASNSYKISLRATVRNKVGKHESVIVSRDVNIGPAECAQPRLPSNLLVARRINRHFISFQCRSGTQLRGRNYATCNGYGKWSKFPICAETRQRCVAPLVKHSLTSLLMRQSVFGKGEVLRYTCRPGYILRGNGTLTCTGPHWDNPKPSCIRVTCRLPLLSQHLTRVGRRRIYQVSDSVVFHCERGFRMEGAPRTTCLSNGTWSLNLPTCIKKDIYCQIPFRSRQFSRIHPHKEFYNKSDVVHYTCDPGYVPSRSRSSICLSNGRWSTKLPPCKKYEVKCPISRLVGRRVRPQKYFHVGYTFVFQCPYGYRMYGWPATECLPDGHWSFPRPRCYIDHDLFDEDYIQDVVRDQK